LENSYRHAVRRALVVVDAVSIVVAMIAAMTVHTLLRQNFANFKSPPALELYVLLAYFTLPMWLSIAAVLGLYRQLERPIGALVLLRELVQLHVFGLLGLALLIYTTQIPMNRSVVALFVLITFALMFTTRLLLQMWVRLEYRRGHGQQRVLLVADSGKTVEQVAARINQQPLPPRLVGCLAHESSSDDPQGWQLPILGSPADIRQALHDTAVDLVLLSCRREVVVDIDSLLSACDEVGVRLLCHVHMEHRGNHEIRVADDLGLPTITFGARQRPEDALIIKRVVDLLVATIGLILASPLLLLIMLGIWLTMGRPLLFCQERTGYNGRAFRMYKFRTMKRDAEQQKASLEKLNEIDGPAFKMNSDPRVTPLGSLLRRTSLDELPQLVNVLTGRMSLVGPRPLPVGEQQLIRGAQRRRLSMKPGITGLWQVSGRSDLSFDEWMRLDLAYVDEWSLRLDLQLLMKTIPAVLFGRGAK